MYLTKFSYCSASLSASILSYSDRICVSKSVNNLVQVILSCLVETCPSSSDLLLVLCNSAMILLCSCSCVICDIREGKLAEGLRGGVVLEEDGDDGAITS